MRFRFIEEHVSEFPTNRFCQVLDVSERCLRAYRSRPASQRQRTDLIVLDTSGNNLASVWAATAGQE